MGMVRRLRTCPGVPFNGNEFTGPFGMGLRAVQEPITALVERLWEPMAFLILGKTLPTSSYAMGHPRSEGL